MEKYRAMVDKYDPCILRYAYTLNAVGRYAEAHEILTTRRFHVWEGADGLLAPFVESCLGLGKAAMEKGDYKTALEFFEESFFWEGRDFSLARCRAEWPRSYLRQIYLPILLADFSVWIPVQFAVYVFPLPLQIQLVGFAGAFWSLVGLASGKRLA